MTRLEGSGSTMATLARSLLLALSLATGLLATVTGATAATTGGQKKTSPYVAGMPGSARDHYATTWGVDQLSARLAESGELVRFNYRVVDAKKAALLVDKAASPSLVDEKAHVALQVPNMEKVGPLRQAMPLENGKSYWIVFSNKGNLVKRGHHVSVVIGPVRLDGLVVQ
jgi:hypothetical protein